MKKHDLEKLVVEAQTGNGKAFAAVYSYYAADLYRFALWYTGKSADAEDCVQEAVLLSFRNIASLKKPASFHSWMFKILANVCKSKLLHPADRLCSVPIDEMPEPVNEHGEEDNTLSAELRDALDRLSPEEKQIVLLSVIGRYRSSEIAGMLGIPSGTVRSKLSRSLQKLRDILQ